MHTTNTTLLLLMHSYARDALLWRLRVTMHAHDGLRPTCSSPKLDIFSMKNCDSCKTCYSMFCKSKTKKSPNFAGPERRYQGPLPSKEIRRNAFLDDEWRAQKCNNIRFQSFKSNVTVIIVHLFFPTPVCCHKRLSIYCEAGGDILYTSPVHPAAQSGSNKAIKFLVPKIS